MFCTLPKRPNSRTVELALVQCVIGAKIRPQKHQRRSEKKRIGDPLKGNSSRFVYLEDFDLNFFMFSNLHCRVPLKCFSSLRCMIIYWRFIAGIIKVLQNYVTYLFTCVDIWLKPHYLPSSKIKAASLLISNTIIDFQRISLHRLPVAKSSSSKSGKCILFSYSLHSAVKKKNITKLTRMSYFTPWSNFWRKNSLIRSALFLFQIFVKAMQLGCTLILITALVS